MIPFERKLFEVMLNLKYSDLKDAVEETEGVEIEQVMEFLHSFQGEDTKW